MLKILPKIIPTLVFWTIFIYVILKVPYPETITQASFIQLLSLFVPLFLAVTFSLNIFLKNIFISTSISLGLIFLLFLKALDSLNLVTASLIIIPVGLLVSYFRKNKDKRLTKWRKIPKLTRLRRQK